MVIHTMVHFHVMSNGLKMTGVKHSDNDLIIYDTPQESRTNRTMMSTVTTITTISSPQIEYSPSVTSTDVASDTANMTPDAGSGMISYGSPSPMLITKSISITKSSTKSCTFSSTKSCTVT